MPASQLVATILSDSHGKLLLVRRILYEIYQERSYHNLLQLFQRHRIGIGHYLEYFSCQWDMLSMSFVRMCW